jgi:1-acyl-sn-glycerol-3-phosphate acyltransferase
MFFDPKLRDFVLKYTLTPPHEKVTLNWAHHAIIFFLTPILTLFYKIEVKGLENLQKDTGFILASNHQSNWDGFLLGYILYKKVQRPIIFLAKKELFRGIYQWIGFSFLLKKMQMIPIDRKGFDRNQTALTKGTECLSQGHVIGIFPEGTRTRTGKLRRFRLGAVKMAAETQKDIVPAAIIYGSRKYGQRTIRIHFGQTLSPVYLQNAEEATRTLRERIQSLLEDPL